MNKNMVRFEFVDGGYVNMDCIKEYHQTYDKKVFIKYKDGRSETVSDGYIKFLSGEEFITQVIPCTKPLYAVYKDSGTVVSECEVDYLGLCADGHIRGLILCDDYFEIADTISNFAGLHEVSQYKEGEN